MTGMHSRQNASSQDINLPHHQADGDPFASKLSKEADIIAGIYLLIIGILSTLGNGYVIYISIQRKRKLKPAEIMTVNLAVCDLGISVAGKPFSIIAFFSHRWIFGWSGCRWYGWAGFFFGIGSLITMTAVSLDRYFKICYLAYGLGQGTAAAPLLPPPPCSEHNRLPNSGDPLPSLPTVAVLGLRSAGRLGSRSPEVAMLICAGFLIAWIPYAVVSVWSAFGKPDSVPIKVSVVPTLLAKSAAMYNPVIYQVINCKSACCRPEALRPLRKKNLKKSR
ncbi:PREDICTED: opsin-5 [Thamnophis sirtalis]|uniref:Opsin-5 n=1 Tax=Thamnophis sirtalis TaxID=35019 RepID=A0A6I9Y3G3_9SAUR|nr:PREDICTED: opsin-5 [Thamnophis sirtalis]